ncbi:MAG: glycine dehydrogenase [Rhodothermales bacterium]|jgi:glycine dehydrogenase
MSASSCPIAAALPPPSDRFARRHLGSGDAEIAAMLATVGAPDLESHIRDVVPADIRLDRELQLPDAQGESATIMELAEIAKENQLWRSYLGQGYHAAITPPVILRNILENPGWYTAYTPYQAEISQGRLEVLLNFQTMVAELTGMDIANSSLLDEATAAAEAMTACQRGLGRKGASRSIFWVDAACHPRSIEVIQTRAEPLGIDVRVAPVAEFAPDAQSFGCIVQYPGTDGEIVDFSPVAEAMHAAGGLVVVASDLLALTMLRAPGELGADIVVGNTQRFGMPLGFGGPHAAFMAARDTLKRTLPGRIIGVTRDSNGNHALRMALQTREQHIRREKATSNICTAQVLPAVVATMYAIYHGPDGLREIAERVHGMARVLASAIRNSDSCELLSKAYFDSIRLRVQDPDAVRTAAAEARINLQWNSDGSIGVALDETIRPGELRSLIRVLGGGRVTMPLAESAWPDTLHRQTSYMQHAAFRDYRTEHELLRYIHRLQSRDLSLTTSMIPLGSCTMKLNAAAEMIPISFPGFAGLHPAAPIEQAAGYKRLFTDLEAWLCEISGFHSVCLQPNAGSQGEYLGLLAIRAYHQSRGDHARNACLIPRSAHGTNPASAVLAGMRVIVVDCDDEGNIDVEDLRAKAAKFADELAALMVTYPSTHGVFETTIREICEIIHANGGQVYLDGANMNALVGLCRPGDFGADVCHMNLHKTFCIPHGGGGPGMGPIGLAEHLTPFVPGTPLDPAGEGACGAVSGAPWGSPMILPISYAYIRMMGPDGLRRASELAILNANYMAERLQEHFPVVYKAANGRVAHECIIDVRQLKSVGIEAVDIAKRLMDYGFHAPTMSWPVPGTLMIEPTESESKAELDRFCDALISIREEIRSIAQGGDPENNLLKGAPHTAALCCGDSWDRPYTRESACYPSPWTREHKFWPAVGRVDDTFGDRNLICTCPDISEFAE